MKKERISQECWDLILGSLLGDACLANRKNSYIYIGHSEKQKEYIEHKFNILKEVGASKLSFRFKKLEDKEYGFYECISKSFEWLGKLRRKMYKGGKKTITKDYLEKLTDRALAYWIMDDGSLVWHKRDRKQGKIYSTCEFYLATNSFSESEVDLVIEWFKIKYNLSNPKKRYHKPSNSYVIVINRHDYYLIVDKIKSYIIPSMYYKIDMTKLGQLVVTTQTPTL